MIGAQVIIEPGQTDLEIDTWFKRMNESGMTLCRIRMFEEYIRQPDGTWDFTLFDKAFKSAEKYDIKVFAGLFPASPGNSIGGFKFPLSQAHEGQIRKYIFQLVNHYKSFNSLYGWVLMNEPGTGGGVPNTDYTNAKFEEWKRNQSKSDYNSKGYTLLKSFDKQKFLTDYNTSYLNWIATEITKQDTKHEVHVNNHQIFDNIAEYDFPAWRKFLTSLGASAHPSWHFGYFDRSQYTVALSANCNIVRSGAGNLPYLVTELQGGNNTYSGSNPFCPTAEEITQWLWTSIATGAQGVIFWSLNPRSIGEEAGEWALIDFQNNASDRLNSTEKIIKCMYQNQPLFSNVKPVNSNIHILYNRPSFWIEKEVQYSSGTDFEGRQPGGVIKSALAYYEVLCENGIVPNMSEFSEFDWAKSDYTGVSIILPNTISLPSSYWENIRGFVKKGGKLFVEGITGFFDENMLSLFNTGFPLQDVLGGSLKEVKCTPGDFNMTVSDKMPVHLWKGYIYNNSGKIISKENNLITGTTNKSGKGEVTWIPSLLGLGARRTGNSQALSDLLMQELQPATSIRFAQQEKGLFMQTSKGESSYFSVVINKSGERKKVKINSPYKSKIIFSDNQAKLISNELTINSEESVLIEWQ
jgi:beta-galactosidase